MAIEAKAMAVVQGPSARNSLELFCVFLFLAIVPEVSIALVMHSTFGECYESVP